MMDLTAGTRISFAGMAAKRMCLCSRAGPDTLPLLCGPQGEFGSVTISTSQQQETQLGHEGFQRRTPCSAVNQGSRLRLSPAVGRKIAQGHLLSTAVAVCTNKSS